MEITKLKTRKQNLRLKQEIGIDIKSENELLILLDKLSKGLLVDFEDFKRIAKIKETDNQ